MRSDSGSLDVVHEGSVTDQSRIVVHDAGADDPAQAFALSRLDSGDHLHVPMGIFRSVSRPTYDDLVRGQIAGAVTSAGGPAGDADLDALLRGKDTWTIG